PSPLVRSAGACATPAGSFPAAGALRLTARTSSPRAASSATTSDPSSPVPPITATRMPTCLLDRGRDRPRTLARDESRGADSDALREGRVEHAARVEARLDGEPVGPARVHRGDELVAPRERVDLPPVRSPAERVEGLLVRGQQR